jgi:hypothetical protein
MSQQVAQYPHKMTDSEIVGAIERIATTATKHKILAQKQDCCNEEAAIHRNCFTSSQKYSFYNLSAGVCIHIALRAQSADSAYPHAVFELKCDNFSCLRY